MADTVDNSKKFINAAQLERLAKALDDRHNDYFGSLLNITEGLEEVKADKDDLSRVEAMLGGKSLRYLTQEEYNALSDEEKVDETIAYHITDSNTSDGITEEDLFKILPCYDTRENIVKEYTYDGIVGEREYLTHFVKISNDIYTLEDIKNFYDVVIEISSGDRIIDNLSLPFIPVNEQVLIENKLLFLEVLFVAFEDCELEGFSFTKGIWFLSEDDRNAYVSRFKFIISGEGEFKQLDKKFMTIKPGENVEGQVMIVRIDDEEVIETTAEVGAEVFNISGGTNVAVGQFSHAEGYSAQAIGEISHSEGFYTTAIGNYSHVEGYETTAVGVSSHAEGEGTRALGNTTHSEGNNTEAEGNYSHAEGNNTHTKGEASHAEGYDTYAIGEFSHVEGAFNYANKSCSHAEGSNSKADGVASHVEGFSNEAIGNYSHAEGYDTKAEGIGSHSEGSGTEARGNYSHAEGFMTIAMNDCQHVQGKLNIADEENKYAHIVGNGQEHTDDNISFTYTYSNAHTLDWDGNAWFAGDITIGADNKKLATEEYVDSKGGANIDINAAASDKLNTQDKTIVGAINELELEMFEAKADVIALDEYKLEQEDLPCYDSREYETVTFNYDGNKVGKEIFDFGEGTFVKLTSDVSIHDLEGLRFSTITLYGSDGTHEETRDTVFEGEYLIVQENVYMIGLDLASVMLVLEDTELLENNGVNMQKGLWISHISTPQISLNIYIKSLTYNKHVSGELKKLDEKYLENKPGVCSEGKIYTYTIFDDPDERTTEIEVTHVGESGAESFNKVGEHESIAIGACSHAEGADTISYGYASHSEGFENVALGSYSHVEGLYTYALGAASHAEGSGTSAMREGSHAEGDGTIANGDSQHVQGKYNIKDTEDKYAHIVGNGSSKEQRSNAHTLDWDGNAWFAGKATVSVQPTDNNDLTTKLYVDQSIAQANETYAERAYVNKSLDDKQDKIYVDISSEVDKTERSYINNITSSKVLTPNADNYLILNTSINLIPYKTYCMYFTYDIEGSMNSIRGRSHTAALINEDDITYIGEDSIILYDNCTYTDGKLVENNGTSVLLINEMSRNYTLTAFSIALGGYELLNKDFFLTHRFVTDSDNFASQDYVDNAINEINSENENLQSQINELFQNVSNGKTLIASAITDKGIEASGDETFSSLSDKINQIPVGPPGSNIIGYINENNDIYISLTELESGIYTLKLEDYNGVLDDFHDIGTVEVK